MGKKKRQRQKPQQGQPDSDEEIPKEKCPHLCKALNQNGISKRLKANPNIDGCQECEKESTPSLWMCLQCGHLGCGPNTSNNHAFKHYMTPRSDCHSLSLDVFSMVVWCYQCDKEVSLQSSLRLKELVELIKKNSKINIAPPVQEDKIEPANDNSSAPPSAPSPPLKNNGKKITEPKLKSTVDKSSKFPKEVPREEIVPFTQVKGLKNLGNTCFFNAVLQNLNQTYLLHSLLESHTDPNYVKTFTSYLTPQASYGDYSGVESYPVPLPEHKPVTQSLLSFLNQMKQPNPKKGNAIVVPNGIFGQLCKKYAQFKDLQQQDSHEALRSLLDLIKTEEMKRQKNGLLKYFKNFTKFDPKEESVKKSIKALSRQACHTLVDKIFGGHTISTILCEACHYSSQLLEPFFDLSLSLIEDTRASRPVNTREPVPARRNQEPSKYQTKKMKKKSKKLTKRQLRALKSTSLTMPVTGGASLVGEPVKEIDGELNESEDENFAEDDEYKENLRENSMEASKDENNLIVNSKNAVNGKVDDTLVDSDVDSKGSENLNPLGMENGRGDIKTENSCLNGTHLFGENGDGIEKEIDIEIKVNGDISDNADKNDEPLKNGVIDYDDNIQVEKKDRLFEEPLENGPCEEIENLCTKIKGMTIRNAEKCPSILMDLEVGAQGHKGEALPSPPQEIEEDFLKFQKDFVYKCMSTLASHEDNGTTGLSVTSCLRRFTAPEHLAGANKFFCENCTKKKGKVGEDGKVRGVYSDATKQILLLSCPAILTLHLKRFQQVNYSFRKVDKFVHFPLTLDLAPYCSSISLHLPHMAAVENHVLYSLYGVVEHQGSLNHGHYIAYVKCRPSHSDRFVVHQPLDLDLLKSLLLRGRQNPSDISSATPSIPDGRWYYISDDHVREVPESQVLKCQAYLLFYQRIL